MADSIHCIGGSTGNDAYVQKTGLALNPRTTPFYVGFQMLIPAATLNGWRNGDGITTSGARNGPYFLQMDGFGGVGSNLYDTTNSGTYDVYEDDQIGDTTGVPTGDVWVKYEWQLEPTNGTGPLTIYLDTSVIGTNSSGPFSFFGDIDDVEIGARRGSGDPETGDIYFGEIRIGTAYDAFDLFHFLPATAPDLTAFDTVVGTVTLDTAPSAPPAWSGGGGDVTPPTLLTITASASTVTLTYDEDLQPSPGPAPSEFSVKVNGTTRTVTAAAASGPAATLTIASPVSPGDTVTVTYTG